MKVPVWAAETNDEIRAQEDRYVLFDWWEGGADKVGCGRTEASEGTRYAIRLREADRDWKGAVTVLAGRSLLYGMDDFRNIRLLGMPFIRGILREYEGFDS